MQSELHSPSAKILCDTANQLKSQGKYAEAIASYLQARSIKPDYPEVHSELAEAYLLQGNLPEAIASCKLALKLEPDFAPTYKILGNALQAQGKIEEALRAYLKALQINPEFVEALVNQGSMLCKLGRLDEGIVCYEKAIALQPDLVFAYLNLGNALMYQGKREEVIPYWEKVLELKPELLSAENLNDFGTALGNKKKIELAIKCYQRAIELKPNYELAHFNLATLLKQKGELSAAIFHWQKSLEINPDNAEARNRIGQVLIEQGKLQEAQASYQKESTNLANTGLFHYNLASKLLQEEKFDEALQELEKAIELKPDLSEAYYNIAMIYYRQGKQTGQVKAEQFKDAISKVQKAIDIAPDRLLYHIGMSMLICTPTNRNSNFPVLREAANNYLVNCGQRGQLIAAITFITINVKSGFNLLAKQKFLEIEPQIYERLEELKLDEIALIYTQILFNINYLREDIEANSKLAKVIGEKYVEKCLNANSQQPYYPQPKQGRSQPLRIGIMSSYFIRHSVGWCSYDALRELSKLTPNLYLYMTSDRKQDDRTALFKQCCKELYTPKKFPNGTADGKELLEKVLQDELDVLIDLDSITVPVQVEVIHRKPAPLCLTWLGFEAPFTDESNYFFCDWHTHPDGREKYNREQLIRMPDSFAAISGFECQNVQREMVRKGLRIAQDQVVYLCVAPAYKLNPELMEAQIKILKQVPDSILIYKGHTGDPEVIQSAYREKCEAIGVNFHRIKFLPLAKTEEEHRTTYKIADVFLDSYPYNGGTHSLEGLWFNLPLVTRMGEQYLSRMGYSFLQTLSLSTGVAKSWEEYTNCAIELGKNTELRRSIQQQLIASKQPETLSPLWNPQKFAADMYGMFEKLLAQSGNGEWGVGSGKKMTND